MQLICQMAGMKWQLKTNQIHKGKGFSMITK